MSIVRAIMSPESVDKACYMIYAFLQSVLENVDEKQINHSEKNLINHLSALIEAQANIISSICFLHKYKLTREFFNNRHNDFNVISKQQVFDAIDSIKPAESMVTLIVGRKEEK